MPTSFPHPLQYKTELPSEWGGKGVKRQPGETSVFLWMKGLEFHIGKTQRGKPSYPLLSMSSFCILQPWWCCSVSHMLCQGKCLLKKKKISQRCSAVQESEKHRCLLKRPFQQCWQKFMGTKIMSTILWITQECSDFNVAFSAVCVFLVFFPL